MFPDGDFPAALESMISNNLKLFPHQNGEIDDPVLAGEMVVVHGTLYPDNIHTKLDPDSGQTHYTITGGDRSQGRGLRGQMIDWLVSSCASSPEHQEALINEFLKRYPGDKDRRGLAMHVMYRSIMEAPWFAANNKPEAARNLVGLARDIVKGNGVWRDVNTLLQAAA